MCMHGNTQQIWQKTEYIYDIYMCIACIALLGKFNSCLLPILAQNHCKQTNNQTCHSPTFSRLFP
jgi:hypothetical protein